MDGKKIALSTKLNPFESASTTAARVGFPHFNAEFIELDRLGFSVKLNSVYASVVISLFGDF